MDCTDWGITVNSGIVSLNVEFYVFSNKSSVDADRPDVRGTT